MSRGTAAAAATGSATPPYPDMHLVVQRTSVGKPVGLIVRPASSGAPNPVDFGALVIFSMLSRHTLLKKRVSNADETPEIISGLQWDRGAFRNTRMNYDVWTEALSWLLDGNAFRLFLPMMAPERFPTSDQERLEQLAIPLRRVESRVCIPSHLFAQNYQKRFEIACFLDATFNADLATVKAILDNSRDPATLLSISGEVLVDGYPDITRRGTALQLALRSGDTEIVDLMARYLPPSEFIRQFESVFGTDFSAFERKQKEDAVKLFEGLEDAFNRASATEISNALNHVPGTTSALHTKLAAFKLALEKYILENPNHNDFILAKAYEIYEKNWSPWSGDQLCLFSQQIIGLVQASAKKTSSFRLQDYAQGIYYRGEKNEAPARSYNLRGTSVDIRSLVDLGSTSCINILARLGLGGIRTLCPVPPPSILEKLCRAKTAGFQNFMRRAREHLRDRSDERRCVVQ